MRFLLHFASLSDSKFDIFIGLLYFSLYKECGRQFTPSTVLSFPPIYDVQQRVHLVYRRGFCNKVWIVGIGIILIRDGLGRGLFDRAGGFV